MLLQWVVTWSLAIDVTVPEENCVALGGGSALTVTPNIRYLSCDVERFKSKLDKYLHRKSFYTLEEYYDSCKS
jgi:hypothetical protein